MELATEPIVRTFAPTVQVSSEGAAVPTFPASPDRTVHRASPPIPDRPAA